MQFKRLVPLKKIIINSLGNEKSVKYLHGVDVTYADTTTYSNTSNIYQDALGYLYNGDMDKAINYVIFGLDIERNNKLLFNLCKNMTFLLSKHLAENNAELYRQKYSPSLEKSVSLINKKVKEMVKKLELEHGMVGKLEVELANSKPTFLSVNKFFVTYWLKKRKLAPILKAYKATVAEHEKKINDLKIDLDEIESFVQVEEDVKVLGLIIEVCVFPSKFEWLINKAEKKPENVA